MVERMYINLHQPSSTLINPHQPSSTFINLFPDYKSKISREEK